MPSPRLSAFCLFAPLPAPAAPCQHITTEARACCGSSLEHKLWCVGQVTKSFIKPSASGAHRFDKHVPGPTASGAGMDAVKGLGERVSALVEQYIAGEEEVTRAEGVHAFPRFSDPSVQGGHVSSSSFWPAGSGQPWSRLIAWLVLER